MLTPEYLQNVPDNMIKLYAQAEADILADMARRISTYDYWIPAVEHQTKMLEEAGMVREDILARLKKLTGKTKKELRELMQDAGNVALKSDDEVYKRNGLDPPPIGASKDLQQILQAGYDKTAGTFQNLTMTTVRTATRQFEQALDRAYMQITMGGMDYNTSIRRAIKQLSADGVGAIKYPSGRVDSIEVAVRRALVTGVNQTALRLQDARADEVGSDLVEVSAHSGARPEHARWQGGIYSRSGKSKKYPGLVEVTGYGTALGLGGINCSHSFRPWFEGMSRTYSEGLLEEYEARNFEYNGKKLTEYEALQEQRKIERNIRRWKREQNAMAAAGQDVSEAAAKVREWNATHRDFLEQTGLKPDGTRLAVGKGGVLGEKTDRISAFQNAKKNLDNQILKLADMENQLDKMLDDYMDAIDTPKEKALEKAHSKKFDEVEKFKQLIEESKAILSQKESEAVLEIGKNLASKMGVPVDRVKLEGLPYDSADLIYKSTRIVVNRYPELRGHLYSFEYDNDATKTAYAACTAVTGELKVYKAFTNFERLIKEYAEDVSLGFHPAGTDYRSLIVHELGHALDGYMTKRGMFGGNLKTAKRSSTEITNQVLSKLGYVYPDRKHLKAQGYTFEEINDIILNNKKDFITKHVSEYAAKNENEFFAECFAEYVMGKNPRKAAKIFGEIIDTALGR